MLWTPDIRPGGGLEPEFRAAGLETASGILNTKDPKVNTKSGRLRKSDYICRFKKGRSFQNASAV
jgi:hypothetical protein